MSSVATAVPLVGRRSSLIDKIGGTLPIINILELLSNTWEGPAVCCSDKLLPILAGRVMLMHEWQEGEALCESYARPLA